MLAEKGRYAGFEGTLNSHLRNPLVELPMKAEDTFKDVDAIILTHTHEDHWDEVAQKILPNPSKFLCSMNGMATYSKRKVLLT